MKKITIINLLLIFLFSLFVFSCKKIDENSLPDFNPDNENNYLKRNEATWISSNNSSKGFWLNLKIYVGHTAEQCGGRCVKLFGKPMHIDCRGIGHICERLITVELQTNENNELMLILSDEDIFAEYDIFPFPDRSLCITNPQNNDDLWLNIPEQILLKDSTFLKVIIENIWFSEEPELENI